MKLIRLTSVLTVILIALFLSGCTGGGGSPATNEQKIHNVLDQYESAMKTKDAQKLADLATYPIYMDGEYLETKEQAEAMYSFSFLLLEEVHEFKIIDRKITVTDNEAVAEFTIKSRITALGQTMDDEQAGALQFRKVGNAWKISGQ